MPSAPVEYTANPYMIPAGNPYVYGYSGYPGYYYPTPPPHHHNHPSASPLRYPVRGVNGTRPPNALPYPYSTSTAAPGGGANTANRPPLAHHHPSPGHFSYYYAPYYDDRYAYAVMPPVQNSRGLPTPAPTPSQSPISPSQPAGASGSSTSSLSPAVGRYPTADARWANTMSWPMDPNSASEFDGRLMPPVGYAATAPKQGNVPGSAGPAIQQTASTVGPVLLNGHNSVAGGRQSSTQRGNGANANNDESEATGTSDVGSESLQRHQSNQEQYDGSKTSEPLKPKLGRPSQMQRPNHNPPGSKSNLGNNNVASSNANDPTSATMTQNGSIVAKSPGRNVIVGNKSQEEGELAPLHERKVYACSMEGCNKSFTRQYNLKAHIRAHSGDFVF